MSHHSASSPPNGVSILIPTHNRAAILARTLESLAALSIPAGARAEVVVVANACTDNTEAVVAAHASRLAMPLRCIAEPTPGLSVARNRAVAEARHDLLVFLDDDVRVDPGLLVAHLSLFAEHGADLTAGRVALWWEEAADPGWLSAGMQTALGQYDLGPGIVPVPSGEVRGCNFGFRRSVFDKVGPFHAALGRTGAGLLAGEEVFFSSAAIRAGFRCVYSGAAAIEHWVPARRVDPAYLANVSAGSAYSIELLRPRSTPITVARSVIMGLMRVVGYSILAPLAMAAGQKSRAIYARVQRAVGIGQIRGVLARVRNGPLAKT